MSSIWKKSHVQLKNATTKPKEYAVVNTFVLPIMNPVPNKMSTMSKKRRSRKRIQELLIAAIVKIMVRMNHAHRYIAKAWLNSGRRVPVCESV